jgi:hypothetical protein
VLFVPGRLLGLTALVDALQMTVVGEEVLRRDIRAKDLEIAAVTTALNAKLQDHLLLLDASRLGIKEKEKMKMRTTLCVSSYYYLCVLILLDCSGSKARKSLLAAVVKQVYMRPHTGVLLLDA